MSAQKTRPTLDSLSSRFARKDAPAAAVPSAPASNEPVEPATAKPKAGTEARVQILTRIDAATRKRLKLIAVEQERTIQDICEEAIRDFVARHSK